MYTTSFVVLFTGKPSKNPVSSTSNKPLWFGCDYVAQFKGPT